MLLLIDPCSESIAYSVFGLVGYNVEPIRARVIIAKYNSDYNYNSNDSDNHNNNNHDHNHNNNHYHYHYCSRNRKKEGNGLFY